MEYIQALKTLSTRYQKIYQDKLVAEDAQTESYRLRLSGVCKGYVKAKPKKLRALTIPEIFKRSYDENFISDYLAYILDPQRNGIGTAPLKAVLKLCSIECDDSYLEDALIHREFILENGRIDLLIECGDGLVLGIENKILSSEGGGQTDYYSRIMAETFTDVPYHLIFLTRNGVRASSEEFIPISYGMLLAAFKEVSLSDLDKPRPLFIWNDFLKHLEVYIMAKNPEHFELSDKARLYIDNFEMIDDLTTSFRREWDGIISFLENQILGHVQDDTWTTVFQPRNNFQQIFKPPWNSGSSNIHYEWWLGPYSLNEGEFAFGVDVEGKLAVEALKLFDELFPSIKSQYLQKSISYRPRNRRVAIAYKEYAIEKDINLISKKFMESFDEFRFLEPVIDEVLAELSKKV